MILTFDDPDGLDDEHIDFDNLDGDGIGPNNELAVHYELDEDRAEYGGPNDDNPNGCAVLTPLDALKDHNPKLGEALSDGFSRSSKKIFTGTFILNFVLLLVEQQPGNDKKGQTGDGNTEE